MSKKMSKKMSDKHIEKINKAQHEAERIKGIWLKAQNKIASLIIVLLFISLTYADNVGGGGGSSIPLAFTYEECNHLLDDQLIQYKKATEKMQHRARILSSWLVTIFLLSIIYCLIITGMNIQQIKEKGIKKWWISKWKKT